MNAPLLQVRNLTVAAGGRPLLQGLNLDLRPGQIWGLLGGNGSGKTSLLLTLAGLRPPAAGEIHLAGQPLARLTPLQQARLRGYLPQESLDELPTRVLDRALSGRYPHTPPWGGYRPDDLAHAHAALATLDLEPLAQRRTDTLSGGEARRAALAALLTQSPRLYLLDEPTNHLDLGHQAALLRHLAHLARQGAGLIMSLHDPNQAARHCDHLILLHRDGHAETGSTAERLNAETLGRLYGHPVQAVETPQGWRFFAE